MPDEKTPPVDEPVAAPADNEHGLGAQRSPDDPRDFLASALFEEFPAAVDPSRHWYYVPRRPPITNQGLTPQCVAFSNATDQNHLDRKELGRYFDFDRATFFERIGGGPNGAYMRAALQERLERGYPEKDPGDRDASRHRISAYYRVPLDYHTIKRAIATLPGDGGVLVIGPWPHSWNRPRADGVVPQPDYDIGGHAWWADGWNDDRGIRCVNSWGENWGRNGRFFIPPSLIGRLWEVWRTVDA